MTPADYVEEIVLPTVREFAEDRRSHRLAYLACLASLRITDHLRQAGEEDVEARIRFAAGSAFEAVRAILDGGEPFCESRPAGHAPGLMDGAAAPYRSEDSGSPGRRDLLACLRQVLSAYRTEYGAVLGRFHLGPALRTGTAGGPTRSAHGDGAPGA